MGWRAIPSRRCGGTPPSVVGPVGPFQSKLNQRGEEAKKRMRTDEKKRKELISVSNRSLVPILARAR